MESKKHLREISHFSQSAISLKYVLKNYYETYSDFALMPGGFEELYFFKGPPIILSVVNSNTYIARYFASITSIHLFFEHKIQEILNEVNPIFAKEWLGKKLDLMKVLSGNVNSIKCGDRHVGSAGLIKRFGELVAHHDNLTPEYQIPSQFHFIQDHLGTLKQLAIYRNDVIHSGVHYLPLYYYDRFFVNKLLPLVKKVISTDKKASYKGELVERNIARGLNILDEIIRYPLAENCSDVNNFEPLIKLLKRLNHFKQLGRASYENKLIMFEIDRTEEQEKSIEATHNKPRRKEAEQYALFRQKQLRYGNIYSCPCCGTNSLLAYGISSHIKAEIAKCYQCSYKVEAQLDEPKIFDLMDEEIFKEY